MTSLFSRHIACNRCRLRKVKCDGRRPWCRRCSGTGAELECSYETKGRSNSKRQDACSYPSIDATHFALFDLPTDIDESKRSLARSPNAGSFDETVIPNFPAIQDLRMAMVQPPGMDFSMSPCPNVQPFTFQEHMTNPNSSCDFDKPMSSLDIDVLEPTEVLFPFNPLIGIESIPFEYLSELYGPTSAVGTAGTNLERYHKYFMTTHQTFPLINQEVFISSVSTITNSHEALALRSAVCAHGAAMSLKFMTWAVLNLPFVGDQNYGQWFYQHAKCHLGKAETGSQGTPSLAALQATVLLGLYELKQAQFSQAWVTTSRAVWVAQCLQHTKAELLLHPARRRRALLSAPPTPTTTTSLVTNEERNAMWAVLSLNCFLFMGVSSNVIDIVAQNEMGAYLPRHDELDISLRLDDVLTKARQAFQLSVKQHLSIATILCTRTFYHIKMMNHADPLDRNPYNFWTQHYHLDEAIRDVGCSTPGLANRLTSASKDVNCSIVVSILLKATATCLHEALLAKAEREVPIKGSSKHAIQAHSSNALTLQNSLDVAELVQAGVSTEEANSSIFLPWSIYVAIQSLLRHQRRSSNTPVLTRARSQTPNSSDDSVTLSCRTNPNSFRENCVRCGTASQSSSFEEDDTAGLLAEAVVLDAINALRSSLAYLSHKMPLARFFYDEAQIEAQGSDELADRVVGLAAFMNVE